MREFPEQLKPENWSWRWILGILGFFVCLNLLGPKGLLHLVLLEQQTRHLQTEVTELEARLAETRAEIAAFERDPAMQKRILRSRMGYLKPEEFRFEFLAEKPD